MMARWNIGRTYNDRANEAGTSSEQGLRPSGESLDKHIFSYTKLIMRCLFILIGITSMSSGFFLSSCSSFIIKEHLFGNYYLTAPDVIEQCALSYHEKEGDNYGIVIKATVFAVGYNDRYLIAKQYCDYSSQLDKTNIRYYILPLEKDMDWNTKNGLIGPLDSLSFENMRKELGIDRLIFTNKIDI